jgi:hypothetical protein
MREWKLWLWKMRIFSSWSGIYHDENCYNGTSYVPKFIRMDSNELFLFQSGVGIGMSHIPGRHRTLWYI